MLRPQRNGSNFKANIRSNSYSIPNRLPKEQAKTFNHKLATAAQIFDLPVETLKKPLNNIVGTDLAKTKKEDDWAKPIISITLQNGSESQSKLLNPDVSTLKQFPNRAIYNGSSMAQTIKKNQTVNDEGNLFIKVTKQIKSASQPSVNKSQPIKVNNFLSHLDDGNSIISAYLKANYSELPKIPKVQKYQQPKVKTQAQTKLEEMFNTNNSKQPTSIKPSKQRSNQKIEQQIVQNIEQEIDQDYYKQQFQSIRESINNSGSKSADKSGSMIRESIKAESSIKESIKSAKDIGKSKFSSSIPEYVQNQSNNIIQESIEAYEDDFEASKSKYQSPHQRKINSQQSLSKSFRKKKSVLPEPSSRKSKQFQQSIKLSKQNQRQLDFLKSEARQTMIKTKKFGESWNKKENNYTSEKINSLYHKFQYQLQRYMKNGALEQKVKKLVSFLPTQSHKNTTDMILSNILEAVNDLKSTSVNANLMQKMQQDYDKKLQQMLKNQERILRLDLERRLNQRDEQLKKIIEGLSGLQPAKGNPRDRLLDILNKNRNIENYQPQQIPLNQQFDYKNYKLQDYSQQYSYVSWESSIDLWDNITEQQKKKIYQKNSNNVVEFLTKKMLQEIKQEAIQRSVDISFQFPDYIENYTPVNQVKPTLLQKSNISTVQKPNISIISQKSNDDYSPPEQPPLISNLKTVSKAKSVISKYLRKIRSKQPKLFKQISSHLNFQSPNILNLINSIKILQSSQRDKQDQQYLKAFQQHILIQIINFFNSHTLESKKLELLFKQRFEHILSLSSSQYLLSIQKAITDKKKQNIPFSDRLTKYTYNRLEGEEVEKEVIWEFEDKKENGNIRKKLEQMVLGQLIEEVAKEMKVRR